VFLYYKQPPETKANLSFAAVAVHSGRLADGPDLRTSPAL